MKKKQFCSNCMEDRTCTYNEGIKKETINGKEIEYVEKYYICDKCCSKIYGDFLDYNTKEANNKLRKKTGLITIGEIEELMSKYAIGKKPLSLVLGLGEITITRYLDGQNPTKENSELLKSVLDNSLLYEMFLIANKDKISNIAFKKSMGKAKQEELKSTKSILYNVSLYLLEREYEIDQLSIQKQLFFINGFSKHFLNKRLINDKAECWKYGPVYRDIYDAFSYYGYNKIDFDELTKDRIINLSDEEKKYIDAMIDAFGFYSGSILREMTHLTDPWIKARIGLNDNDNSNREIDNKDIDNYFQKICIDYDIKTYDDVKKYSEDLFKKAKINMMEKLNNDK